MLARNLGTTNETGAARNGRMTAAASSAMISVCVTAHTLASDKAKASSAAPAPMNVMRETSRN